MMNLALRPKLSTARTTLDSLPSSSDDDPHYGQVTPHHLVSPAMRRHTHGHEHLKFGFEFGASDPPSDDSNVSLGSPTRDHVERRRERLMAMSSSSPSSAVEEAQARRRADVGLPPSRLTRILLGSAEVGETDV